jgi:hypothetical protein
MPSDGDKQWIANQIAASEERVSAGIEKTETVFLTEFHKWASPVEMRQLTHAAKLRAIDAEVEFFKNDKGDVTHLIIYQGGQSLKGIRK